MMQKWCQNDLKMEPKSLPKVDQKSTKIDEKSSKFIEIHCKYVVFVKITLFEKTKKKQQQKTKEKKQ